MRRLVSLAVLWGLATPLLLSTAACGGANEAQAKKAPASCPYRRPAKKRSYWWRKAQDR